MGFRRHPATHRFTLALPLLGLFACGKDPAKPAGIPDAGVASDVPQAGDATVHGGGGDSAAGSFVYFVRQGGGTHTAAMAAGSITVNSTFSASGNAFKYVAPNYYGTASNGFIAFPTPMTGDFSIGAEVTITAQNKSNNVCGIGLGATAGFDATDPYAFVLMRNANNATGGFYATTANIAAGGPVVDFTNNTPLALTFRRTGTNVTYGAGAVGQAPTLVTTATSALTTDTAYGDGPLYPALSFNNVAATITKLVITDGGGKIVYDSSTGGVVNYVPASLSLSATTASLNKGATSTVTATAIAIGGAVSPITAVADDPSIALVSVTNDAANATIKLTGLKGGVTKVTVTNTTDSKEATKSKVLSVAVNDYAATDDYGPTPLVAYPAPGATAAYTDGELSLTFDAPPKLNVGGTIKVFKLADGTEVDSIAFLGETLTLGTTTLAVDHQLVRVDGNTVFFQTHPGKLAYATGYFVVIPATAITGSILGVPFKGLSNLNTVATWKFTTRPAPTLVATNITVDGSPASTANFRTVNAALTAAATGLTTAPAITINVAAGTYRELLRYNGPAGTVGQTVRIIGPAGNKQGDTCVVQWINGNAWNGSTQTRASFYFTGANLILNNITLKNLAVRSVLGQAETIYFASGANATFAAFNSSFISNQDTIQTTGRNWFYQCHIEGNTDFIWGTANAALFEGCTLRVANDSPNGGSGAYSMIVARTGTTIPANGNGTVGKGYLLMNSTVMVDAKTTVYFGRDAGTGNFYDQVALINVAFRGEGTIGAGLWNTGTLPLSLGDSSYVGWKAVGCTGLNLASLTTAAGTSATVAAKDTEYDTRDHILNRVIKVTAGAPSGYEAVSAPWDVSPLATEWNAP